MNILHSDIVTNYLIIYRKLKTTSLDTHCRHYLVEKLDDENNKLHRQCLCAISEFKAQNSKFKIQSLEFIELQIGIIKIPNIALQNSYIHNMMELYTVQKIMNPKIIPI